MRNVLALLAALVALAVAAPHADAAVHVKNPRHAHVVKRGVTHNGKFTFTRWSGKVYVVGSGWKRTVFRPRPVRVVAHWRTKHSKCVRYNQRVRHGKGRGHRMVCRPILTREDRIRRAVVAFARSKVGTMYLWGGTGPRYDCSGLIFAAYRSQGISIPRTTWGQLAGMHRPRHGLRPGDLVFPGSGHVGMYVGHGRVIEAPHTGAQVRWTSMGRFNYAHRSVFR